MATAVLLRSVVALAGRFPVLAGADLSAAEGDMVVLRGPNGAGKTSLLRLCAGLLPVAAGEAVVLGHDLTVDRRSVRRHVGLLGHATFLYDDLSVVDNVRFAVRAAGGSRRAADDAVERMGVGGRRRSLPVARLSAGQRRRAALAVLVARRPRLWLMDEPHAGLDPAGRELVDDLMAEARAGGATVIVATHEGGVTGAARVVTVSGGRTLEPARVA